MAARQYDLTRLSESQLLEFAATDPVRLALAQNPALTPAHIEALLTSVLALHRLDAHGLLRFVEALAAAGHTWVRPEVVRRLQALLAGGWPARGCPIRQKEAVLYSLLLLDWFGVTSEDLDRLLRWAPGTPPGEVVHAVLRHPAVSLCLVRRYLQLYPGDPSLLLTLAAAPIVSAHEDLLEAVLRDAPAAALPLVARHCTPAQLTAQIARYVGSGRYAPAALLQMFEAMAPEQMARLHPDALMPLLAHADATMRVTGQIVLGMLPNRAAGVSPTSAAIADAAAGHDRHADRERPAILAGPASAPSRSERA